MTADRSGTSDSSGHVASPSGEMMPDTATRTTDAASSVRLVIGAVCMVAGVFALAWPDRTLLFVGVLIGAQLILVGTVRLWAIRSLVRSRRVKLLGYPLAALTVLAGIFCMLRPGTSVLLVAILIGAGWIADGIIELVACVTGSVSDRGYALSTGLFSLLGGIVVLIFPRTSLVTLAQVSGVVLLIFGVAHLASGIVGRRADHAAHRRA